MVVLLLTGLSVGGLLTLVQTLLRFPAIQLHLGSVADACLWLLVAAYWLALTLVVLSFAVSHIFVQ